MKTKMWIDPIVEDVHKVREELAREVDYDIKRLGARLQESQKRYGGKLVTLTPQKLTH